MIKIPASLPTPRVFELPREMENLYDGLEEIDIGPRWMGQQVRKNDMHLELGGPKHRYESFFFVQVVKYPQEASDGRVTLYGPDIPEISPGTSYPAGIYFKLYGSALTEDHTEFLERQIQVAWDHIEHVMLLNARTTTWSRIGLDVADRLTFARLAQAVRASLRTTVPLVEAVETVFIIGAPETGGVDPIREMLPAVKAVWTVLDARAEGLDEDDVDMFYGCTICQSFAPNHVCVISPTRFPYCGIMSYLGARVSVEIDPSGYVFEVPKGQVADPVFGQYAGVNEAIRRKSNNTVKKVSLFSAIKYPQTNCGCFEVIAFYMPEVDGLGVVSRRFFGDTPLGLTFSKLAAIISGGAQNHGFLGLSVRSLRSKTFLQGDGGWERIVWIDSSLKAEVAEAIPEQIYDQIATEETAADLGRLKDFLITGKHPVIERFWRNGAPRPMEIPIPGQDWKE